MLDVFQSKLVKRGISLKSLDAGEPGPPASSTRSPPPPPRASAQENAKKVSKLIRDEGPKGVKAQIQGDELRVSSKSRDDLQAVQALIKGRTTTSPSSSPTTADRSRSAGASTLTGELPSTSRSVS